MYIPNQKFLILGVSKSGFSVCNHILERGGECYFYEEKQSEKIDKNLSILTSKGAIKVERSDFERVLNFIDVVVISPGVPINHEVAVKAKRLGVRIIGELEFAVNCFAPCIVGVTGTNGKTTTCNMIHSVLTCANLSSNLVGNVGIPLTQEINNLSSKDVCVTEVSSFQLESVSTLKPHVSCILNIAPDHLERHYSMDNYVFLKKRIFKNQKSSEYCVLNYDDEIVKGFDEEVNAKIIWVSTTQKVEGAYVQGDAMMFFDEEIMSVNDLPLKGVHNVYNALFTIAVSKLLGVENSLIKKALSTFKGVKHRIERIGEKDGVTYFNDSKATNVQSTLSAIDCMEAPTVLILGGSEKGERYDLLFEKIKNSQIKHTVLTGASRFNMLDCANKLGVGNLTVTEDFFVAVNIAMLIASKGDNLLLSPACASFDFFNSYEERGNRFCELTGFNSD